MVEKEASQAPFNMALYTLESIRKWIDKIAEISIGIVGTERLNPNEVIIIKHKMVKQLIMLSTPLLDSEQLDEIEEFFSKIKMSVGKIKSKDGWRHNVPVYQTEVDYQLDECVQGIEIALQETGHFMPSEEDEMF